jgi:ribosomal protein L22
VKCGVGTTDGPQELLLRVCRPVDRRRADDAGEIVENILRKRRGGFLDKHGDDTKEKGAVDAVEFEEKAAEEDPEGAKR